MGLLYFTNKNCMEEVKTLTIIMNFTFRILKVVWVKKKTNSQQTKNREAQRLININVMDMDGYYVK